MKTIATAARERISVLRESIDAALVPAMRPDEYAELKADITLHGIKVPLDIHHNRVLDGRHRLQIARELGLREVPIREVMLGGESPTDWMLKAAIIRRHLTDDQRAMMAALYAKAHPEKPGRKSQTITVPTPEGRPQTVTVRIATPTGGGNSKKAQRHPARTSAAQQMNVAPKRTEKAAKVLKANPALAAKVHAGEMKLAQAVRTVIHTEQLARVATFLPTEGIYDVLVVDPPWEYDRQPADSGMRGDCQYLTESLEQLKRRTLPAAADAVLWLWTTNAFMREAHELAHTWGFTVKTILTWDKVHVGLGSWLRNVTEHCLLAVRGKPTVTLSNQSTLIRETRREHSRKPEAFYLLVESLCPGRKWELFARAPRQGWASEGIERDKFAAAASL